MALVTSSKHLSMKPHGTMRFGCFKCSAQGAWWRGVRVKRWTEVMWRAVLQTAYRKPKEVVVQALLFMQKSALPSI